MILNRLGALLKGDNLKARATRGSLLTILHFGAANFLRLASNLILVRILFPEAFGLMALVQVIVTALEMFSAIGVGTAVVQNKRGDEPAFLNTAWMVQILRGLLLWGASIALAYPAAAFYEQPILAQLIPVAGFAMVITGFHSTKIFTADRHLLLGRLTFIEIFSQFVGIVAMILAAWATESVWSLLVSLLVAALVRTWMSHSFMPGMSNRFEWDSPAFWAIFHYGKYLLVVNVANFLIKAGDRAILGKFVSLTELAVYNFGYFLATVPMVLAQSVGFKVLTPIYARLADSTSDHDRTQRIKARGLIVLGMLGFSVFCSIIGVWLVELLYSPEYYLAGPIMVLLALAYMPSIIIHSYGLRLLGEGNSRDMTIFSIIQAVAQTLFLLVGVQYMGLMGAVIAPPLAVLVAYPVLAWLVGRHHGWEPKQDIVFVAIIIAGTALALWINDTSVAQVRAGVSDHAPAVVTDRP